MELNEDIDIIEYRGFKQFFIGLYKGKKDYYILYGFTEKPSINISKDEYYYLGRDITRLGYSPSEAWLKIPFISKEKNILYYAMHINDKEEYHHIINILETIMK